VAGAPSEDEGSPPPKQSPARRWVILLLKIVIIGGLFVWVGRSVARDASSLDWSNLIRNPGAIVAAVGLWVCAFVFRAWLWGAMMRRTGYPVGHVAGARVFLASHMGRFLPGKVWSVAGAGIFGREHGLPPRASAVSMTIFLIIYYMMGSLVALLVIWRLGQTKLLAAVGIGVGGIAALGLLMSPLFPKLLHWVGRKFNRDMSELKLPSPATLAGVALGLAAVWTGAGLGFAVMLEGVVPASTPDVPLVIGIGTYASALVAGFAALFAPAGLGVREAVMLGLLEPSIGAALAGLATIASRILITSLELSLSLWGAWPFLVSRRRKKAVAVSAGAADDLT